MSIARSELGAIIYGALGGRVETIFRDSVRALDDDGNRVRVTFDSGTIRDFDLVIGADGLHSQVRRLVFGPQERFEKYLGITVAAFEVEGYRPRDERVAVMYTQVGYQVTRLSMRDEVTMFLFTLVDDGSVANHGADAQQAALRARLAGARWEIPAILERMGDAKTFYCDRVSQIDAVLDARPRGIARRCCGVRVTPGRSGLCAGDGGGVRAGRRVGTGAGESRPSVRALRADADAVPAIEAESGSSAGARFRAAQRHAALPP